MHPKSAPKTSTNRSKNGPHSIKNGSEINAQKTTGFTTAFWMHLGHLGSHLGPKKPDKGGTRDSNPPTALRAGVVGRGRGGVNPSPGTGGLGVMLLCS